MRTVKKWGLAAAVAGLLGIAGASAPAEAQSTKLRFQASFPSSSLNFDNFKWWADRVKLMSGGRIEIEVLPAGTLVPAFEVLDAVHKGVIDGGHTAAAYWVGKHRAAALFGPSPGGPFGMDIVDLMGWMYEGGGLELWKELYQNELKRNVIPMPLTAVNNQVLGWFKTPVKSWEDLKGRKCRQTGLTAEVFAKAGLSPVNMPGGEIVPAGERGVIECGEWVGPAEDMKIGFHTVWKHFYMPSTHEPATVLELLIGGEPYNKLSPDLRAIIESAAYEGTYRHFALLNKLNADAIEELTTKHAVKIERTPDDILKKILVAWDEIAAAESAKNPFFKKVYDSQRAYAGKVVPARRSVQPNYDIGANHYWPEKK
ncbi:MAG TPA: TRAP transporter substrate-binding protein [Hyphomicrobiaceae bacterium]|nr:TRAP transporter substrate-binding protein [Hyphomicrobiaceae bacterium]